MYILLRSRQGRPIELITFRSRRCADAVRLPTQIAAAAATASLLSGHAKDKRARTDASNSLGYFFRVLSFVSRTHADDWTFAT